MAKGKDFCRFDKRRKGLGMKVVLDSSVFVSMFSDEDKFHDIGRDIFLKIIEKKIEPIVPTLALPEICGVFRRNFGLHLAMIVEDRINSLIDSNMLFVKELTIERMRAATEDAIRFGLKGGDAVFVSLTRELKVQFLTFDDNVKRKIMSKIKLFEM